MCFFIVTFPFVCIIWCHVIEHPQFHCGELYVILFLPHNFQLVILLPSSRSPSKPLARKVMSGMDWEVVSRNSLSDDRLETQSLPSRSPPGTPNQ